MFCFASFGVVFNDAQIFQVRFSRPETEQARQRRVQSYEFLQKRQAEEHWVHLHYYGLKVGVFWLLKRLPRPEGSAKCRTVFKFGPTGIRESSKDNEQK